MNKLLSDFKEHVIVEAQKKTFIHNEWFVQYHLEIVEKLCYEIFGVLKEKKIEADWNIVYVLVWLHDYGKIIDFKNSYETTVTLGKSKLLEIGFDESFVNKVIDYVKILDSKMTIDLHNSPIEVQIVSSADACSHFIGPFFNMRRHENPEKNYRDLMQDNIRKAMKDWDRKIVLDFVKEKIEPRFKFLLEQCGQFPDKLL